ncbi:hypothetical protein [Rubrivirga marina]|uniref:hypothetical protein n=1 Tax=Rubrivirga marina TaxID=1196024 RepID=UPI00117B6365|nr:hypothetical protein [Rubrivirga marina]
MASALPFSNVGVYVAVGGNESCGRTDPRVTDGEGTLNGRAMAFSTDGDFFVARSVEDMRTSLTSRDDYGPIVSRGNYRVVGGRVDARAVIPGGDSSFRHIVVTYTLIPTGPESFLSEQLFSRGKVVVRYGEHEERWVCYRQRFELSRSE